MSSREPGLAVGFVLVVVETPLVDPLVASGLLSSGKL